MTIDFSEHGDEFDRRLTASDVINRITALTNHLDSTLEAARRLPKGDADASRLAIGGVGALATARDNVVYAKEFFEEIRDLEVRDG